MRNVIVFEYVDFLNLSLLFIFVIIITFKIAKIVFSCLLLYCLKNIKGVLNA